MNIEDSVTVIGGTVVGVLVLWAGAATWVSSYKEDQARKREIAEHYARIPDPKPWIPPEQRHRL